MSSENKNLSEIPEISLSHPASVRLSIVTSEWNNEITASMQAACIQCLLEYGILRENIIITKVPGAFELVLGAKWALSSDKTDAVICIGCVIKGETKHDEYISTAVAHGIMSLSLASNKPVVFGVLTPNDIKQAFDRAGGKYGNKGVEAATSALKMIAIEQHLKNDKKKIGFN
jgi:6,7-dimethyl-8-ribityllumazine synthase